MAYPVYPYGYSPYYGQPGPDQLTQMRQNQMQIQPQMMQTAVPQQMPAASIPQIPASVPQNSGMIWVGSKNEADNYPIAPGCAVALWDSNNPVIYLRKADSTGKPGTVVYDLVERTDSPSAQTTPQIDFSRFITREQLEDILAERLKRPSKPAKPKEDTENG